MDEDRRVERRVRGPPALPLGVLVPPRIAELSGTHDLGADTRIVQPQKRVVDPPGAIGLADHFVPPPGGEHPFVQPFTGVAERRVETQAFARPEAVERDREELDARACHG